MEVKKGKTIWDYFDRQEEPDRGLSVYVCKSCGARVPFVNIWHLLDHLCSPAKKN